ncbi:MAG: Uma2 family endonuclease [Chloroflexi bacterium]|nr:Uma2 family endonuclease [Chloroflexota bacterium]
MVERTRMTTEEYFALPETTQPMELINGELIVSPAPVPRHQGITGNTYYVVRNLTKTIGGTVYMAPIDVYLDEGQVPQPDVVYLAPDSRCQVTDKRLVGPPDLVVEVFSPGSVRKDKLDKFELYERYGVREYWMIDPLEQYIEVYRRDGETLLWQGVYGPGQTFTSTVLAGATIVVDDLLAE